jgi:Cilia BBSome complex subunit 10
MEEILAQQRELQQRHGDEAVPGASESSSHTVPALPQQPPPVVIEELLPKAGLFYSERGALTEVLCKPKLLPIKSATLEKMEALEREAAAIGNAGVVAAGRATTAVNK